MRNRKAGWIKFRAPYILLFLLSACAHGPFDGKESALRKQSLAFQLSDSASAESLEASLASAIALLSAEPQGTKMSFADYSISTSDYRIALEHLLGQLQQDPSKELFMETLRFGFDTFEVFGGEEWGRVELSSYALPRVKAARAPSPDFPQALYRVPPDLVRIRLAEYAKKFPNLAALGAGVGASLKIGPVLFARALGNKANPDALPAVVPYPNRAEIEAKHLLAHRGLEMAWLGEADALRVEDLGIAELNFSNGDKWLVDEVANNGQSHTAGSENLQAQNPYFGFFRRAGARPASRLGALLVENRAIASDYRYFPKGALAVLGCGEKRDQIERATIAANLDNAWENLGTNSVRMYASEKAPNRSAYLYFFAPKESLLAALRRASLDGQSGMRSLPTSGGLR